MVHGSQVPHRLLEQWQHPSGFGQACGAGGQERLQRVEVAQVRAIVGHVEYFDDLPIHAIDPVQDGTFHLVYHLSDVVFRRRVDDQRHLTFLVQRPE